MDDTQMGVLELSAYWRTAASYARGAAEQLRLLQCAEQLDRAYHNDHHDAEWRPGCKFCDAERREQGS